MEFLLQFAPEQQCMECGEMTSTGIADSGHNERSLYVEPYCPRQGYMGTVHNPPARQDELDSIAIFVLSENGDQGQVTDITPIPLEEPAAHHINVCPSDKAWKVKFKSDEGRKVFYVIWSVEHTEFSLHRKRV